MTDLFALLLWGFLGLIVLSLIWLVAKQTTEKTVRTRFRPTFRKGRRGEFEGQMETDLRLTYKRFKELYPHSTITYQEYKKLQSEKAFRRAVSSQKIKRMVR
jgi:hypothetical protein